MKVLKSFLIGVILLALFSAIAVGALFALGATVGALEPDWLFPAIDASWSDWIVNRVMLGLLFIMGAVGISIFIALALSLGGYEV